MEVQQRSGPERRDEQSVEIAFAIITGAAVFLGLVISAVMIGHVLGIDDAPGSAPIGAVGLLLAAAAGVASTIVIVVRARQRGL